MFHELDLRCVFLLVGEEMLVPLRFEFLGPDVLDAEPAFVHATKLNEQVELHVPVHRDLVIVVIVVEVLVCDLFVFGPHENVHAVEDEQPQALHRVEHYEEVDDHVH